MREENRRITVAPGVRRLRAHNQRHLSILLCGAALLQAGCSKGSTHTLEESRVVESSKVDFGKTTTTAERFGVSGGSSNPHDPSNPHGSNPGSSSSAPADNSGIEWTTPPGWTEQPASSMRVVNLRPAGDERAECYLTMLAGDAGGLAGNVNRWRGQLGLQPFSAQEIDALMSFKFFDHEGVFVDFTGTWKGMSGGDAKPGWRMIGILLCEPGGSGFLKMIGPDEVVGKERDAFIALARSFRPKGAPAPSDANTSAPTDASRTPAVVEHATATTDSAAGFTFTTPAGWHRAPDRPARAFTFFAGSGESLECYVTTLGGDAGGPLANVNRWRGQLGLTSVTDADVAAMPTIDMLGRKAVLVECDGTAASLIGASCNDSKGSVFVKMTGPRDLVKAQRGAFLAFCGSLAGTK